MSNLNHEDYEFIYWHAMAKLRAGSFYSAGQLFRMLFAERRNFFAGMALAYCYYRDKQLEEARAILPQISPTSAREEKLYQRLCKRVGL